MRRTLVIPFILLLLGCAAEEKRLALSPLPEGINPPAPLMEDTEGSLWRGEGPRNQYFVDLKARWIGDVVTVKIVEMNVASKEAKTETDRESEVDAKIDTFFGAPSHFGLPKIWPGGFKPEVKGGMESDFEGSGSTSRTVKFIATITARVVDVLPNGNLVIEGRREVRINREKEYLVIRGIVRPEDIGPDNTVLSTAIADARIAYSGSGVISDKQGPGFLARILDWVWPF